VEGTESNTPQRTRWKWKWKWKNGRILSKIVFAVFDSWKMEEEVGLGPVGLWAQALRFHISKYFKILSFILSWCV